jgi:hypothetical protein
MFGGSGILTISYGAGLYLIFIASLLCPAAAYYYIKKL